MIEPVYVLYEYRAAKTRCGLDSRIYGNCQTKINLKSGLGPNTKMN
jgi:hypothetical protein